MGVCGLDSSGSRYGLQHSAHYTEMETNVLSIIEHPSAGIISEY